MHAANTCVYSPQGGGSNKKGRACGLPRAELNASFLGHARDESGHARRVTTHGEAFIGAKGASFDGSGDYLTIRNFEYALSQMHMY